MGMLLAYLPGTLFLASRAFRSYFMKLYDTPMKRNSADMIARLVFALTLPAAVFLSELAQWRVLTTAVLLLLAGFVTSCP